LVAGGFEPGPDDGYSLPSRARATNSAAPKFSLHPADVWPGSDPPRVAIEKTDLFPDEDNFQDN
jgi:hypothetical protein